MGSFSTLVLWRLVIVDADSLLVLSMVGGPIEVTEDDVPVRLWGANDLLCSGVDMDNLCPNSLKIGLGDDEGGTATLLRSRTDERLRPFSRDVLWDPDRDSFGGDIRELSRLASDSSDEPLPPNAYSVVVRGDGGGGLFFFSNERDLLEISGCSGRQCECVRNMTHMMSHTSHLKHHHPSLRASNLENLCYDQITVAP